jgi:large subunit ribosomal protein L21
MFAVIKTGGKQYKVAAGDTLVVEKLEGEAGSAVTFDTVLMVGGEGGVTVGAPVVAGATVAATLVDTRKGDKVMVVKKTRRNTYRRRNGHRQWGSVVKIDAVNA